MPRSVNDSVLLAFLVMSWAVSQAIGGGPEWSQWRGPRHDGHYPAEKNWTAAWGKQGPTLLWKRTVGTGYATVAISEGRVYAVGHPEGPDDVVYCLDRRTGEPVWTARYPQDLVATFNPGGPNAAPVVDGQWLYVFAKQGLLTCFDKASGHVRWRRDLAKQEDVKVPTWGFASAPLVVGDRLYLNANESGVAIDKNTGEVIWKSRAESSGYASPVALRHGKDDCLAVFGTRALFVVRQSDGEQLWRVPWPTKMGENSADPLAVGELLYVSSWWDMGAALFDLNQPADKPVWTNKVFQNHIAAPVLHEGYLYGFEGPVHRRTQKISLKCIDFKTGEEKWSQPAMVGSLIIADGKLIILTNEGELVIAAASPAGYRQINRAKVVGARSWAPPVLHHGLLYLRDADSVYCFDLRADQHGAAEAEPDTNAITIGQALAVPIVQRQGFAGVHTDPVEAQIVGGTWKAPKAGDTIEDAGRTETWALLKADDEGWLKDERMRRGGMYVYATVQSDRDEVRLLDVDALAMLYVNGELRVGDIYNKGRTILPVLLHKGRNELLFVAVNRTGRMRATLSPARSAAVFNLHDTTLPDLVVGEHVDCWAAVPVLNARNAWADDLYLTATAGDIHCQMKLPTIVPQGLRKVGFKLTGPAPTNTDAVEVKLRLTRRQQGDQRGEVLDEAVIKLDVKDPADLQKRTFISKIDGSVQYFALWRASKPAKPGEKRAGLILTLHGAAVEARGQAAAYGEAFDWAHLVAPTNRRPFGFDWESFGELDAMEVLDVASKMLNPDPQRIYLSGHSMGGHGTWHVGVTHPDRFAAIGPSAAWISLFSMDAVRKALEQPGAPGFTDMHELLARPRLVSDTLALSRNLKQLGIYILHGEKDDNVPVGQSRQMKQYLAGFHKDFDYHEQPGAGHWWGKPCVNWPPMMAFFQKHTIPPLRQVKEVDFATANPAIESTCHWVTIEQQTHPSQISSVTMSCDAQNKTFKGATDNVARLTLRLDHLLAEGEAAPKTISLTLDGQVLSDLPWPADHRLHLRRGDENKWAIAPPIGPDEKSPQRQGPFLHAFNHHVIFVVGTHGSPQENTWAIAKARFDAERFWYQGNGSADIVRDSDFDPAAEPDRSVILFGNATTNSAWAALMKDCPIQVSASKVTLNLTGTHQSRTFGGENIACLLTWRRPGSRTALVGVVGGSGIVGCRLTDRLTSFSSRAGFPDWIVVGDDMLTHGTTAVRTAGYFDNAWRIGATDRILAK